MLQECNNPIGGVPRQKVCEIGPQTYSRGPQLIPDDINGYGKVCWNWENLRMMESDARDAVFDVMLNRPEEQCPDLSSNLVVDNNGCVCNTTKSVRTVLSRFGYAVFACVLPDYSPTDCWSGADCTYPDSQCACVNAHFQSHNETSTCTKWQCIPKFGASNGNLCHSSRLCASRNCQTIDESSNKRRCE